MSVKVTVGIPAYNSKPHYFWQAMECLRDCPVQGLDIALSDNGSGPEAQALYDEFARRDPRVRIVRHPVNRGAIFNFLHLLKEARGEYFMWLADDDVRSAAYLPRAIEILDADPGVVSVGSRVGLIDNDGRRVGHALLGAEASSATRAIRIRAAVAPQAAVDAYNLHRMSALRLAGTGKQALGIDVSILTELLLQGRFVRLESEEFCYRVDAAKMVNEGYSERLMADPVAVKWEGHRERLCLDLLAVVLTFPMELSLAERTACFLSLAEALVQAGWFTWQARGEARSDLVRALARRDVSGIATAGARFLALSPTVPFRGSAWRSAASVLRARLRGPHAAASAPHTPEPQ